MSGDEQVWRRPSSSKPSDPAEADRKERMSERLDEGLMETFPASDPVSVANIR